MRHNYELNSLWVVLPFAYLHHKSVNTKQNYYREIASPDLTKIKKGTTL